MSSRHLHGVLLASWSGLATAFRFTKNVNFNSCYEILVAGNTTLYPLLSDSRTFYGDSKARILTLWGCEKLCEDGYQLWSVKDTMSRLSLWVVPGLVLITNFQFPPLPWYNALAVIVHAIGDPVDSLWSILTRHEVQRRLSRVARSLAKNDRRHIATVLAAYEEVGWQDASGFFSQEARFPDGEETSDELSSHRAAPRPNEEEMLCIMEASHELSRNRLDSMLMSWVAILVLFIALATALIRTVDKDEQRTARLDTETSHTIAVVALLFIFIPLTKLSGDIGSFTAVSTAVDAIEKLNIKLEALQTPTERQLFPPLRLPEDPILEGRGIAERRYSALEDGERLGDAATTNIKRWPSMASYFGMNSSWRPDKRIPFGTWRRLRSYLLLLYSLIFVVLGSAGPAIFLSATNRAEKQKVGFGCRSLSWTATLIARLISFGSNYLLRRLFPRVRTFWRVTIAKDSIFTIFMILVILTVQLGYFNSCWCRSNIISLGKNAYVNLNPFSDSEWRLCKIKWSTIPSVGFAITIGLIFWIERPRLISCIKRPRLIFRNARGPLCKSPRQLQKDLELLEDKRCKAQGQGTESLVDGVVLQ